MSDLLAPLPEDGWGVLRCSPVVMLVLAGAGLVRIQLTARVGVYQARLTSAGKRYRAR